MIAQIVIDARDEAARRRLEIVALIAARRVIEIRLEVRAQRVEIGGQHPRNIRAGVTRCTGRGSKRRPRRRIGGKFRSLSSLRRRKARMSNSLAEPVGKSTDDQRSGTSEPPIR